MPAAALDGRIYLLGGRFETFKNNTGVNEVYDPATDSWEKVALLPTLRSGTAGVALNGRVLVFSGEEPTGTFEENEAYDPLTDTWEELAPLPTPVTGSARPRSAAQYTFPPVRPSRAAVSKAMF
jgi:hypothetical protein